MLDEHRGLGRPKQNSRLVSLGPVRIQLRRITLTATAISREEAWYVARYLESALTSQRRSAEEPQARVYRGFETIGRVSRSPPEPPSR